MALDETQSTAVDAPLYAARVPVLPRSVNGFFRRLKWWIMGLCLAVYYITPWLRWERGPDMPDQAVLVDLAGRRFFFFFIEIWPTEFYYVAGLLIMAGLGLFLFTAVLGRVWCGYACPQTVWTDLFTHVERWIDGDRNAQIRLWNAPWSALKLRKRTIKWSIWFLIALATGGAWIFYFADAPALAYGFVTGEAPLVAYVSVAVLTFTTFTLGGFMREQVCIYMCPWPRIQAAMMDENTLTVAYRDDRGEPRGKHRKRAGAEDLGDCIDCNACVAVCPTGIDIRDGQQLGCITCALCIDACDEIMERVGKPRGLIDYVALDDTRRIQSGEQPLSILSRVLRVRTIIYFTLWSGIGIAMLGVLATRDTLDLRISHQRNPTFVILSDGAARNAYAIRIANRTHAEAEFSIAVDGVAGITASLAGRDGLIVQVPADKVGEHRLFVTAPPGTVAPGQNTLTFSITNTVTGEREASDTVFIAPEEEQGP
ncbi:MAG: cytochrome c oxidase accessory protein CcoG [Pseudomonadota bacterium]